MSPMELLALALALSVLVAALAVVVGTPLERRLRDPGVRERAWAAALYISALPPLLVGLLLLLPARVVEATGVSGLASIEASISVSAVSARPGPDLAVIALGLVSVAALVALVRALNLARRCLQLRVLVRATVEPPAALVETVRNAALTVGVSLPAVRVSALPDAEPMVTGLLNPVLIIPERMAIRPADPATVAVCAHELAHLKRGDHRALWVEEVVLTILAANPLLAVLRSRRSAAREEACDAVALADASLASRRRYARLLLDALKTSAFSTDFPALTFTSAKRTFAMLRLKAILEPASPARPRDRWTVAGLGALIAAASLGGSIAVASEREPAPASDTASTPQPRTAIAPLAPPVASSRPAPVAPTVPARPASAPVRVSALAPQARPSSGNDGVSAPPAPVITNVTWTRHPTPAFPSEAARNGVSQGSTTVSCAPQSDGRLSDCKILAEDPAGNGFGTATLAAMQTARVAPRMRGAASDSALIVFSVRFRLAE